MQRRDFLDIRTQVSDLGFRQVDAGEEILLRKDVGAGRYGRSAGIGILRRLGIVGQFLVQLWLC